jgi:hypothetical protein
MKKHEQSHMDDQLKQCPTIGKKQPPNRPIANPDQKELAESEVKAYQKSIDCLRKLHNPSVEGRIRLETRYLNINAAKLQK